MKHRCVCQTNQSSDTGVDILVGGPPCQPFTDMRVTSGPANSKQAPTPEGHPDYQVTFGKVEDIVKARRPRAAMIEQVWPFTTKRRVEDGATFIEAFVAMLKRYFGGVRAVRAEAEIWLEDVRRTRVYICAFSDRVGGAAAADKRVELMAEVAKYRKVNAPCCAFGNLFPADDQAVARAHYESLQDTS